MLAGSLARSAALCKGCTTLVPTIILYPHAQQRERSFRLPSSLTSCSSSPLVSPSSPFLFNSSSFRTYATVASQSTPPSSSASSSSSTTTSSASKCSFFLDSAVCSIPDPSKAHKGGEDAHFISKNKSVVGVADGVGGWSSAGVDPALYSRGIMEGARKFVDDKDSKNPVDIIHAGWVYASNIVGSSTCCVCVLDGCHVLSANLGDSGFMIVRGENIIHRTKEQQHDFNFPYQLGSQSDDLPTHANRDKVEVQDGDILILGTDGLFDNLYDNEITTITKQTSDPATLAQQIGARASSVAKKKSGRSPFADAAEKAAFIWHGGKLDDITVVVSKIATKQ